MSGFGDGVFWAVTLGNGFGQGDSLADLRRRFAVGNVQTNSAEYLIANQIGAIEGGATLGGLIGLAGKGMQGFEYSHFVPQRLLNLVGISRSWRPIYNGTYVPSMYHALTDLYRYRFVPRSIKGVIGAQSFIPQGIQQILRIPPIFWGAGIGAAAEPGD